VLESLGQGHSLGSIDADYACDCADDELVDVVILHQGCPFLQNETDQVDDLTDLLVLNFHGQA